MFSDKILIYVHIPEIFFQVTAISSNGVALYLFKIVLKENITGKKENVTLFSISNKFNSHLFKANIMDL